MDALPKKAEAASSADLKAVFEKHLTETTGQASRPEDVCAKLGIEPDANACEAMEGLIAAARKVEHHEIARYGTLCVFARQFGHGDLATTLHGIPDEEKGADEALTELAEAGLNAEAQA